MLAWFSIPLACSLMRFVWRAEGRPLNDALAGTGRLTLLYGVLFSLGIVLSAL
jgi:1,4-dihydroxy-2-naphthoate octaprenyltransferase